MKQNILKGKFIFPKDVEFSKEGKDIVIQLLQVDPKNRLGSEGFDQIMNHPWFEVVDWDLLIQKKIKSTLTINVLRVNDTT